MECKSFAFGTTVSCLCVCMYVCLSIFIRKWRNTVLLIKCWMFLSFLEIIKMWITEFKVLARLRGPDKQWKTFHWNLPNYTGLRMGNVGHVPSMVEDGRVHLAYYQEKSYSRRMIYLMLWFNLNTEWKKHLFFFFFKQKDLYFTICFDQNV